MELKQVLPNHNKHKNKTVLSIHSCNECFRKQNKCFKDNLNGRKAFMYFMKYLNEVQSDFRLTSIGFSLPKLQEDSYWLDLAQMN